MYIIEKLCGGNNMNYDFLELDDIFDDNYDLEIEDDSSDKIVIEKYSNDKKINNNDYILTLNKVNENIEIINELKKLKKIKENLGTNNAKEKENEYFANYDCFTEREKIKLEALYIKFNLLKHKDLYKKNPNYKLNLKIVNAIILTIGIIRASDLPKVKQCLVLMELELNMDISFYSEVDNVYKIKMKKMEENNKKKKGL